MARLVLLLVFVFSHSVGPFAGPVAAQDLLPSIQRIADRGVLRIAIVDGDRPPMVERVEDGSLDGFDIELGNDIARALGVRPEFVNAGPGNREVVDFVASGGADIGLSYLSESVELAKRVIFSDPYMIESYTVLLNRAEALQSFEDCPSISDLRRLAREEGHVGALKSGPFAALIHRGANAPMPRQYDSLGAMLSALQEGEIVASIQGELSAVPPFTSSCRRSAPADVRPPQTAAPGRRGCRPRVCRSCALA